MRGRPPTFPKTTKLQMLVRLPTDLVPLLPKPTAKYVQQLIIRDMEAKNDSVRKDESEA
jgi:hypothetical protein